MDKRITLGDSGKQIFCGCHGVTVGAARGEEESVWEKEESGGVEEFGKRW